MAGLTYDEALVGHVGQLGHGQLHGLAVASMPLLGNALAFFLWTFCTIDPVAHHAWACSSASDAACAAVWAQARPASADFCALSPSQWHWTSHDSLVAKFSLVCGDAWKVQITNSLMFVGAFVGSGVFGFVCDRLGRKRPLFAATALVASAMFASLAAPSYWAMAALRVVTGFGAAGQSHTIFLLATEPVGPAYRGVASILTLAFFTTGELLLVALAFAMPAWQQLMLTSACVNVALLLPLLFVPESGRWLLSQGRVQEATAGLQRLAAANKSRLPHQPLVASRSTTQLQGGGAGGDAYAAAEQGFNPPGSGDGSEAPSTEQGRVGLAQMLRNPRLAKRLLVLVVTQFSLMLNYYGIAMGAGGIPGSIYMTFAVGAAAEVLALLVVGAAVDRVGRHNCVSLGQLLGGAACLAWALVQGGPTQAALAAVGKFGAAAAQAVISLYVAELLPTSCRSSVMGISSQASRLGSITAPFLLMLGAQLGSIGGRSQVFIPFLVFGSLALLSGLLTLLMPETLGAAMPETMQDLEQLLSAFTARPWRQGCTGMLAFLFRTHAAVVAAAVAAASRRASATAAGSPEPTGSAAGPDAAVHVKFAASASKGKPQHDGACGDDTGGN